MTSALSHGDPNRSKFVIKRSKDNRFFFVFKAGNGETVVISETYNTKASCQHGISCLVSGAASALSADESATG